MTALSDRLADAKGDRSIDSIVAQAEANGHTIDRSTVARYCGGGGAKNPPDAVLRALAAGLGLDVRELRTLAGKPAGELGPWTPPDESARLSRDQRKALDLLIKAIVNEGSEHGDRDTASMNEGAEVRQLTRREEMQHVQKKAARKEPT